MSRNTLGLVALTTICAGTLIVHINTGSGTGSAILLAVEGTITCIAAIRTIVRYVKK